MKDIEMRKHKIIDVRLEESPTVIGVVCVWLIYEGGIETYFNTAGKKLKHFTKEDIEFIKLKFNTILI